MLVVVAFGRQTHRVFGYGHWRSIGATLLGMKRKLGRGQWIHLCLNLIDHAHQILQRSDILILFTNSSNGARVCPCKDQTHATLA
ncbi:hypothetical protein BX666DRAFT_1885700 [Dichotomocladium elegans]|nr:hypothetical protein BX666DRAFT_1885700 [Dichotomocladium elegans]